MDDGNDISKTDGTTSTGIPSTSDGSTQEKRQRESSPAPASKSEMTSSTNYNMVPRKDFTFYHGVVI